MRLLRSSRRPFSFAFPSGILLSAMTLVTACGSSSGPTTPPPSSGVLTGVVREAAGGPTISGATVAVGAVQTSSAANGSYQLSGLPAGVRVISASAIGYEPYTTSVTIVNGENQHDIVLEPLMLGTLSGVVVADMTDDPVVGATVRAGGKQTTSGAGGAYELTDLPIGPVEVTSTAAGFNDYAESVDIAEGDNQHDIRMPPQTLFEQGPFAMYLPAEVETVKGVFFYVAGLNADLREAIYAAAGTGEFSAEVPAVIREMWEVTLPNLARKHGLAMMTAFLADGVETSDVFGSFTGFASQTGHAELASASLLAVGYSFGGCFSGRVAAENPGRMIGLHVLKGSCLLPVDIDLKAGDLQSMPALFVNADNDGSVGQGTRDGIEAVFEANRVDGAPWAMAVHPTETHAISDPGRSLWARWVADILELRLPEGAAEVQDIVETNGWLGDRETLEIAAFDDFTGDVSAASWFPSMEMAQMWQAYVSGDM